MADQLAPSARHVYAHDGRKIYEWDQTVSEVNVYVEVPAGVKSKAVFCDISINHLKFGLQGNPAFLDMDLGGSVKVSESYWTLEDSVLHITLTKMQQGDPWPSAILGHSLDPMTQQADQERLLLERFQIEHPGFDFSTAKFSGSAPNPNTFMGGMKTV
jgi:hypothetical protein